jgi:voltage-gated potassium channel
MERNDDGGMPRRRPATWTLVLRLTVLVTVISSFVVLSSGAALWFVERDRPDSTVHTFGDALWWSLSTMTTVGYGDHVPVTTIGRLIAAAVMVIGVAVIGAVAAILALAMALRVAIEEERAFEAAAKIFEQRIEVRLARIEAQLAGLDARLAAWPPKTISDSMSGSRDEH